MSLQATVGAIAAGCTVCLKLSELTPHFAGTLQRLIPQYLDQDAVKVVCGGVPEVTKVLEHKWDHSECFTSVIITERHSTQFSTPEMDWSRASSPLPLRNI